MTAPQQQYPQPPTGYGFGQPGQYPVGPPNPQVQPTPQQQYYGQPAPQQTQGASLPAVPPPVPTLAQGGGGGAWPKMRNMVDRLIIVEPIRVDETATDPKGKPRPEAYFNLTVCNGGPLRYGDSEDEDKPRAHTHEVDTPYRWSNVNSYSYGFVQAVRDALQNGERARVGIVQRGTMGNKPYLITKPSTDVLGNARPNGDALFAEGMAIWTKVWNSLHPGGEPWVNPTPRSLVVAPPTPQPQVSYGPPAPGAQYNPYAPQGQYVTPYAAANPGHGPYGDGPGPGYQQQPAYAPPQQFTPPQPAAPEFAPPVEAWIASLPPEAQASAREQMRAQAGSVGGQPQPAGPQGPGI